jgi:hypothetical protein
MAAASRLRSCRFASSSSTLGAGSSPRSPVRACGDGLKDAIIDARAAILASDERISEYVKWNVPSFCYQGDDRVTFMLQPGDRLQLVFHRGAKVRADSDYFTFEDETGLLEWASADRGHPHPA